MRNILTVALIASLSILVEAGVQILHPKDLKDKLGNDGLIRTSLANFGHIIYGTSVLGRVYYPQSTNTDGCTPFRMEVDFPKGFQDDEKSDLTPVVMVDRGNCTFVTKVRNIEKLGVHLGIISDDKSEDSENLIMSDDGTGTTVNIPSFIIRKKDADAIKRAINATGGSGVYIKANLDIVHPDNRVEYEFWYSTLLDFEPWLLYDISLYQKALQSDALVTPRILTFSCKACSEELKKNMCLADGEYCPYFPKQKTPEKLAGIKDNQFLYESLRQKCVYQVTSQESSDQWFAYTVGFVDNCMTNLTFNEECAVTQMKKHNINHESVNKCVQDSFVKGKNGMITDNTLLKEDAIWAKNLGIFLHPSITVNNMTFRGDLNGFDIFRAVCAGFKDQPQVCKGDNIFDTIAKLEDAQATTSDDGSSSHRRSKQHAKAFHIVLAVVVVMLLNFGALYLYRRHNKKKMNQELQMQVNSAVSQYFKLSGQDNI